MAALFTTMIASLPSTFSDHSISSSLDDTLTTDPDIIWPGHSQVNELSLDSDDVTQDDATRSGESIPESGKPDISGSGDSTFDSSSLIPSTDGKEASIDQCGEVQTNKKLHMRVSGAVCHSRQAPALRTENPIQESPSTNELTPFSIPLLDKDPDKGCSDDVKLTRKLCCPAKQTQGPAWARVHYYAMLIRCTPFHEFGESFIRRSFFTSFSKGGYECSRRVSWPRRALWAIWFIW